MSHLKERQEKNCLNCNAQVYGRFCQVCGQENVETRESTWHLIRHFFEDLTHFDGKFFSTYRHIALKPGYLPQEYFRGRRASYLNPLRMYIFTSAAFFLIFFSLTANSVNSADPLEPAFQVKAALDRRINSNQRALAGISDSAVRARLQRKLDTFAFYRKWLDRDSAAGLTAYLKYEQTTITGLVRHDYTSVAAYDSIQANEPPSARDNWLTGLINRKLVGANEKYRKQGIDLEQRLIDKFLHSFPQLLFISLPLTSLILGLLYVRRKNFLYVHHLIFTVYLYIFTFVFALLVIGFGQFIDWVDWPWLEWLVGLGVLIPWIYQYKAMRRFYQQSRLKTMLKFTLYNLATLIIVSVLFTLFFFISIFQIG